MSFVKVGMPRGCPAAPRNIVNPNDIYNAPWSFYARYLVVYSVVCSPGIN